MRNPINNNISLSMWRYINMYFTHRINPSTTTGLRLNIEAGYVRLDWGW